MSGCTRLLLAVLLCAASLEASEAPTAIVVPEHAGLNTHAYPQSSGDSGSEERSLRVLSAVSYVEARHLHSEGKFIQALESYEKVAQADPSFLPPQLARASILLDLDRSREALLLLEELRSRHPDSAELKSLLAIAYLKKNDAKRAREFTSESLAQAASDDQRHDISYYSRMTERLGRLMVELDIASSAQDMSLQLLPLLEKAASADPHNPHVHFRIGEMALNLAKDPAKAARYFQQTYRISPDFPGVQEKLSIALLASNRIPEAIEVLETLLKNEPLRRNLYPVLAELYDQTHDFKKAEAYFKKSIDLGFDNAQHYLQYAINLIRNDKAPLAADILLKAQQEYKELPQIPFLRGLALRNMENYPEAIASLQSAEEFGKNSRDFLSSNFYFELGATHEQAGNFEQAEYEFQRAISLDPDNHRALNYLGYMWAERDENLEQAHDMIARALEIDPDNPAYLDSLGWVCFRMKRFEEALLFVQRASTSMNADPVVQDHLGEIYFGMGNDPKAIEHWTLALDKSKTPDLIEAKIKKAKKRLGSTPTAVTDPSSVSTAAPSDG